MQHTIIIDKLVQSYFLNNIWRQSQANRRLILFSMDAMLGKPHLSAWKEFYFLGELITKYHRVNSIHYEYSTIIPLLHYLHG